MRVTLRSSIHEGTTGRASHAFNVKREVTNKGQHRFFFIISTSMATTTTRQHVSAHALSIPAFNKLAGKRIVLASASPRRKEILKTFVRSYPSILAQPNFRLASQHLYFCFYCDCCLRSERYKFRDSNRKLFLRRLKRIYLEVSSITSTNIPLPLLLIK